MNIKTLEGKTIRSTEWIKGYDGSKAEEGYGQLQLIFTDNTSVIVHYSCMGGVYIEEELLNQQEGKDEHQT